MRWTGVDIYGRQEEALEDPTTALADVSMHLNRLVSYA